MNIFNIRKFIKDQKEEQEKERREAIKEVIKLELKDYAKRLEEEIFTPLDLMMMASTMRSFDYFTDKKIEQYREKLEQKCKDLLNLNKISVRSDPWSFSNWIFTRNDFLSEYYNKYPTSYEVIAKANQEANLKRKQEEAQQQEIEREKNRRKNLAAKYKYSSLAGYKIAYLYDYYPVNKFPTVSPEDNCRRKLIWNFKDGDYYYGVRCISDFLEGNFSSEQIKKLTLCVIPASSKFKNHRRYAQMCANISDKFKLENGFPYISVVYDKDDSRLQKSSNTIVNLSFSTAVYGKDIILFDDITTRGTSFIQVANVLKAKGAKSIYGVFLGKTVSCL